MGCMRFTHEEMTGKIGSLSGGQKAKILFLDMVLRTPMCFCSMNLHEISVLSPGLL